MTESVSLLRRQLRWAWAELGCRCIFDRFNRKTHEDSHCPVHGVYRPPEPAPWEQTGGMG